MPMLALTNGTVVTPFVTLAGATVLLDGATIAGVGRGLALPPDATRIDVGGRLIAPGFIETHIHGTGGFDVMSGYHAIRGMARLLVRHGVTSFLPTTLAAAWEDTMRVLEEIDLLATERTGGARVLGSHMEGPFLNPQQAGAMNVQFLAEPTPDRTRTMLEKLRHLRRVSAAPELPGAIELGAALRGRGILASMAHTDASYQQVSAAVAAGYSHATHIFTCMSSVRRRSAYRIAGVLESTLLLDGISTEVIADGHHLPPSLLQLVFKCKGVDRVAGITDSMSAAGLGAGTCTLGGREVVVEADVPAAFESAAQPGNFVAKLADRSAFAGSVATMDQVVRNLVSLAGLSVTDAIRSVTSTPAAIHGLQNRGVIAEGCAGDIAVLDARFVPALTLVDGEIVHSSGVIPLADPVAVS